MQLQMEQYIGYRTLLLLGNPTCVEKCAEERQLLIIPKSFIAGNITVAGIIYISKSICILYLQPMNFN